LTRVTPEQAQRRSRCDGVFVARVRPLQSEARLRRSRLELARRDNTARAGAKGNQNVQTAVGRTAESGCMLQTLLGASPAGKFHFDVTFNSSWYQNNEQQELYFGSAVVDHWEDYAVSRTDVNITEGVVIEYV